MKIATSILKMKTPRASRREAFTIIELLMVIAIMAVVAGLIVGLASVTGDSKRINRAQTELAKLVTFIETYKSKVGVYPPDNTNNPAINSLLYELAGAVRNRTDDTNPTYETPLGNITSNDIWNTYGMVGLINAVEPGTDVEGAKVHRILRDLRSDQSATVAGHRSLVIPVDDPNGQRPNPWKYLVGKHATNNTETFDLWVDIKVRGGAKRIGNWKK